MKQGFLKGGPGRVKPGTTHCERMNQILTKHKPEPLLEKNPEGTANGRPTGKTKV